MPALTNPLNGAQATLEYSTNAGSAYTTFGTEVQKVTPGSQKNKVIERKLLGTTRVQKFVGRIDNGEASFDLEYSSATYTTVTGWRTAGTLMWIRLTAPDSGGTNGSRHVVKGYISEITPPEAKGDDDTMMFTFKIAIDDYAFTAGA